MPSHVFRIQHGGFYTSQSRNVPHTTNVPWAGVLKSLQLPDAGCTGSVRWQTLKNMVISWGYHMDSLGNKQQYMILGSEHSYIYIYIWVN